MHVGGLVNCTDISEPAEKLEVNGNILANGKMLVADDTNTYDLLAMILQLKNEVAELKQQLLAMTEN